MKSGCKIAIVDDHSLIRSGLAALIGSSNFNLILEAENGRDMIEKINKIPKTSFPDVIIVDISMPKMDGFETVAWLKKNYPSINIIVLTMRTSTEDVMKMVKLGVKSYIPKDATTVDLLKAIEDVSRNKFYFPSEITEIIVASHQLTENSNKTNTLVSLLTVRELEFLTLASSELTYKEIADSMGVSPRTVDAFRDALFEKLGVKTRVGLALMAVKHNLISLN